MGLTTVQRDCAACNVYRSIYVTQADPTRQISDPTRRSLTLHDQLMMTPKADFLKYSINIIQCLGESSTLPMHVLDLLYVAPF